MSAASLFRDNALRQQATATLSNEGLVLVSSSARVATATTLAICVAGLVASILVTVPITLDGNGVFLDSGGVSIVTADTAGRVFSLDVAEGATVNRGDVVAHIAQQELTTQTGDARAVLDAAVQERTRVLETMVRTRAALAAHDEVRLAASTRLIAIESENLERLKKRQAANEKLSREGFVSPMSLIDSEQEIIASKRRTREAEDAQRRLDLDLRVEEA